jgi:mersacidin/lichenicidin family type 2 lantibiotic
MPTLEVIKAWKDEEYRDTLTIEQRAQLPSHPSGVIDFGPPELDDETQFGPDAGGCTKTTCGFQPYTRLYTQNKSHC